MFDFDAQKGEILIHDVIGDPEWGYVGAADVRRAMNEIGNKRITLRLNTPGGSIDEGVAIFNMLRNHKPGVTTIVDSLAASMGSYLMLVGDERLVYSNSMVMIHNPWTMAWGDAHVFRAQAEVLDKYKGTLVDMMAKVSGKEGEAINSDLDAETWLAGKESVDYGLATAVIDGDPPVEESVTKGLKSIAARSHAENRIPKAVFERRAKVVKDLVDPLANKTAARIAMAEVDKMLAWIEQEN